MNRNETLQAKQAEQEAMQSDVARTRLHWRGAAHLPLDQQDARRELTEEQRALRSTRPRRRWKQLDKFDAEVDRLQQRQAAAMARVQAAEQRLQQAPADDARDLAAWIVEGERADRRPVPSVYERELERDAANLVVAAAGVALDDLLARRVAHVERHREKMIADSRRDLDAARDRLLEKVGQLPHLREAVLACRETVAWVSTFPGPVEGYGFSTALALGLRAPVEETIGTKGRLEFSSVLEALRRDAEALAATFGPKVAARLGTAPEATPLDRAMWDADPANVEWKKKELLRARQLGEWSPTPHELAREAADLRPTP